MRYSISVSYNSLDNTYSKNGIILKTPYILQLIKLALPFLYRDQQRQC